jgi:hypothetical protein
MKMPQKCFSTDDHLLQGVAGAFVVDDVAAVVVGAGQSRWTGFAQFCP